MFDLKAFIVINIINGIKNGTFTKEYGNIMAVNYYTKNILTEADIIEIDTQITLWEESKLVVEEPEEIPEDTTTDAPVEDIPVDDVPVEDVEIENTETEIQEESEDTSEITEEPTEEV